MTTTTRTPNFTTPVAQETHMQAGLPEDLQKYLASRYGWPEDLALRADTRYVRVTTLERVPDEVIMIIDEMNDHFEATSSTTIGA